MARPRKPIDFDLVKKLATIQCTHEEIAAVLGLSLATLEHNKVFTATYENARREGKCSLRRMMWLAASNGNVTMQIWLSKQMLGYTDKQEIQHGAASTLSDLVKIASNGHDPAKALPLVDATQRPQ